ncbi:hypothetical protein EMCRGX_G012373 [Ephydatia muelleri]
MRLTEGLVVVVILLPYASGLTVGLSENDYSGSASDGSIVASIDRSDTVSSTVTLRVTPMTYAEYSTRYSALAIPPGCYEARSSQFNNTPVQIHITPSTSSATIRFNIGVNDNNESERPKSCFVIALDVLNSAGQTIVIRRNVSALYIYNSHPFTVSFETQEVTVTEDVGTVKIYIVKDNNQKVAYNFTLQLEDLTPAPINTPDTYYSVEQLAIPFPADVQRVPLIITVTNFNVSMENRTLNFLISLRTDYALGQPSLVDVNIISNKYVTVELENATYWLMVCLSVVDPILVRQISLSIQARNITDEQEFFSTSIVLYPMMTRECINVTDDGNFPFFLVTVSALSNAVRIIPDRDIRADVTDKLRPMSSQMKSIESSALNDKSITSFDVLATLFETVTATSTTSAVALFTDSTALYVSHTPIAIITTMASNIATALMSNYATLFIELSSSTLTQEVSTPASSEPTTNVTTQVPTHLLIIATPTSSSRFESTIILMAITSQLMDSIPTTHSSNIFIMRSSSTTRSISIAGGSSHTSDLTGTAEPILTPTPTLNKDYSWLIILAVTIACGLLCCLFCALAACLYICLCHRAHEKAYFPASVEGHDERYHNWRCGVIDEVKLEEYKMLPTQ